MTSLTKDDIVDESQEAYQDPYDDADKDESVPELRKEETGTKSIYKRSGMSEPKMSFQTYCKSRQEYEDAVFKNDTLRRKYDIRNRNKK